jgi:hypothetical protein
MTDKRPDPKPRKHPHLWQAYLWWDEMVQMRKRHLLRITSIEAGKSNLDAQFERDMLERIQLDLLVTYARNTMIDFGAEVGPIWDAMTSIKGLGIGGLAAQVIAQIDDIAKFGTISKLWRFSGYAVIDGKAEKNQRGEKSHYNSRLKSIIYLCTDQFIKQQSIGYVDYYYEAKKKDREQHPEKIKTNGKWKYNDGHIHHRAMRKTSKLFLQHTWLVWRSYEGLPVSRPYVHDILGHGDYITPEMCGWQIELSLA